MTRSSTGRGARPLLPAPARSWEVLLALCLAAILAAGCSRAKLPPLAPGAVVLVVGDSISAGFGVAASDAWPSLLGRHSGWRVINGGVSGDLSADALERLPALLETHTPKLVLLEIGGNDMLRGVPESRTQENLEEMSRVAKEAGAQVVLMAVPRPSLMGAVLSSLKPADFYLRVADRHGIPLLENPLSEVLSREDLKLDPLHPNVAGHAVLAQRAEDGLRDLGLLR